MASEEPKSDPKSVIIFYQATGNAPPLKLKKFKLSVTATAHHILDFLRKQLQFKPEDPLYIFINSAFQPSPDESVEQLYKCFQNDGKLIINYSTTQAWG